MLIQIWLPHEVDKDGSVIEARLSLRQWDCFGILNFWRKSREFYLIPNWRLWLVAKMLVGIAAVSEAAGVSAATHRATIKVESPAEMMLSQALDWVQRP